MSGQFYALAPYPREGTLVLTEHETGSGPDPFGTVFCRIKKNVAPTVNRTADRAASCCSLYRLSVRVSICVLLTDNKAPLVDVKFSAISMSALY
jgi:hypothetical protein